MLKKYIRLCCSLEKMQCIFSLFTNSFDFLLKFYFHWRKGHWKTTKTRHSTLNFSVRLVRILIIPSNKWKLIFFGFFFCIFPPNMKSWIEKNPCELRCGLILSTWWQCTWSFYKAPYYTNLKTFIVLCNIVSENEIQRFQQLTYARWLAQAQFFSITSARSYHLLCSCLNIHLTVLQPKFLQVSCFKNIYIILVVGTVISKCLTLGT